MLMSKENFEDLGGGWIFSRGRGAFRKDLWLLKHIKTCHFLKIHTLERESQRERERETEDVVGGGSIQSPERDSGQPKPTDKFPHMGGVSERVWGWGRAEVPLMSIFGSFTPPIPWKILSCPITSIYSSFRIE